ncbi:probable inactive beta-glucosidase 14 [Medicago truncatula]|uniref:probable inactive beta-glucosidase 14 n=1 Tax=Medicago truncatula TaxID=3880 RepID=UPI000D2F3324|nr:probable inactive beta-glucosidase 14 [Medicago truncatula]
MLQLFVDIEQVCIHHLVAQIHLVIVAMGILRESLLLLPLIFDVYRTKYQTALAWLYVHPQGMENIVTYIKERYNNVPIFITKNGFRTSENSHPTTEDELNDVKRVEYMYMSSYLDSLATAIRKGADVRGYFVWSLLDNFEWNHDYNIRFGLHYVDFATLNRTPKGTTFDQIEVIKYIVDMKLK